MNYILFMDDTGFNKGRGAQVLNDEKSTMCGLLIKEDDLQNVFQDIAKQTSLLEEKYGISEFHFTDMYMRKNGFEAIEGEDSLSFIKAFKDIIKKYDIKILTQTVTGKMIEENPELFKGLDQILSSLEFRTKGDYKNQGYAYLLNLMNIKKYLESQKGYSTLPIVVCDEGLKKDGSEVKLKGLFFYDINLHFESSSEDPFLQLADFSAWALSRTKQTVDKAKDKKMRDFENFILSEIEGIVPNYVNLKSSSVNADNVKAYDEIYNHLTKEKEQK